MCVYVRAKIDHVIRNIVLMDFTNNNKIGGDNDGKNAKK